MDRRTWLDLVEYAVRKLLRDCRANGCTCDPDVSTLPSARDDAYVEVIANHQPGCPARRTES